ncbi:MAG: rhomboid family intramembrane serine protease [Bacteroidota bacterium]|nr:rhomboid family intramembrane serine protease [Bacteroidota bacterium]
MNNLGQRFGLNLTPVVQNLVIINVVMLILSFLAESLFAINLNEKLGMFYLGSDHFNPMQIVTHMFMHGGLGHLFFNMYALVLFGTVLEQTWGGKRFLIYYLITGLGAALIHVLVNYFHAQALMSGISPEMLETIKTEGREILLSGKQYRDSAWASLNLIYNIPTVGASGAVFGVLLAFGMLFPNVRLQLLFPPVALKAKHLVIGYGALELYLGITQPGSNIAHFAHLGGMIFGFIMIKYFQRNQFNQNRWN